MRCVACGGATVAQLIVLERARLRRCVACGHAVSVAVPTVRDHRSYGVRPDARARYERDYLPARAISYARGLAMLPAGGGRLLDVGANYGHFLQQAGTAGWDAYGAESSPGARAAALDAVRERIAADVEACERWAPFAAITLWDVLEHVRDPRALLGRLTALLGEGGLVLVRVPDARALTAFTGLRGQAYLALCHPTNPEEHPHHYTPASLAAIAAHAGLESRDVRHAGDDERVIGSWSAVDRALRAALHRAAADVPYEFTATLARAA